MVKRILLVEDNSLDAKVAIKALGLPELEINITAVTMAIDAINALKDNVFDLVILDLNLPDDEGLSILESIRQSNEVTHRVLPVVVVTTSQNPSDVQAAYLAGANAYVKKPESMGSWNDLARNLDAFWFGAATLPNRNTL